MKKYSNGVALSMYAALNNVGRDCKIVFPVSFLFARRANLKTLEPVVRNFEETRDDIIKKYGKKNEDGSYTVEKGNEDFLHDLNELLAIESELDIKTIKMVDIPDMDVSTFDAIAFMIEE